MRLRRFLLPCLILLASAVQATHNMAGEILVCYVGNNTFEATIITHTNPASQADRPEFILAWGDGDIDTIPRLGEPDQLVIAGVPVQRNYYVASHQYPGPGCYTLSYEDPNRVADVININNSGSVDIPMYVHSQICVLPDPDGWEDCSPVFLNAPLQNACVGECWEHNPGAYDADGDSLSYEQRPCLGADGNVVPLYQYPDELAPGPDNNYSIDPITGTITWCDPQVQGIYNIAFAVKEWRKLGNNWVQIGWVVRDMQVIVGVCNNRPPVVTQVFDTCIEAGTTLNFEVTATDPDPGQVISLFAFGGPMEQVSSPATFVSAPSNSPVDGTFNWNTNCSHVRQQPYAINFKALDNYSPVQLSDYATAFITVVAPAPQNPSATPNASIMQLQWDASTCSNAIGYRIYRRQGLYGFDPDHCETGVPGYTGYTFIGSTEGWNNTTYNDQSLSFGITYCYMVTAYFDDGAESYASDEFCNLLERDVPIMTNVTVITTDVSTGGDSVVWANAWDLDTMQYPGPYYFKLFAGDGFTTANTLIHTTAPSVNFQQVDTMFQHLNIDTRNTAHVYRVELFAQGDTSIGSGNTASSVFLELDPNDEQITVHMNHSTPWINTLFEVYRETTPDVFTLVGTSTTDTYVDTGLVNGELYCYKARTIGAYNDPGIVSPLINWSQEACERPVDLTPPCVPTLSLNNDCETPLNTLTWTNPAEACGDEDTWRYNIWFTDSIGGTLNLISTLTGAELTEFLHTDGQSVAGCYAVSAIDSVGNESALSDTLCGDNCPEYVLPNVYTPNGDNVNDFFVPFPYRGVKEIDLKVYNRWGLVVFSSNDPAIQWPGTLNETTEPVSDGVYFYTCGVVMKRLAGDEVRMLKGYVHVLRGSNKPVN